jgi:phospholipid/cholesterol/gamma-HCH transport system ATP-binding protein
MIKVVKVSKSFDGVPVFKNVSTVFEKGKTNLIIGKSGSGKTVFMKCLVGLLQSDSGHIYYR